MKTITLDTIKAMNAGTFSVQDNSPRGVKTVTAEEIKPGDRVVIYNHFYEVVAAPEQEQAAEQEQDTTADILRKAADIIEARKDRSAWDRGINDYALELLDNLADLTPDGKRQYKSFTADTKKEAEFLAAQYNQNHIDVNRSELPLSAAVERYIKSKENVLSPSTVRGYYVVLNNYLPELMTVKIRDITAERVQEEFNRFAKEYSAKTCRNAHGLISAVLKTQRPEITLNTTLPQKGKRDIYVPDPAEVEKIYPLTIGTPVEIPFLLATQCGLRASEISALDISNVFPDHIQIKQARVDGMDGAVLKAPKSYSGYRSVPISEELYHVLISHAEENRVCPYNSNDISSRWGKFREKHGIDKACNFHALRHHFASRCLLMGMPQKYTAELMGHGSLDMIERVYQHTFPSAMEEYAAKLRKQNSEFMQHKMQHK